MKKILLLSGLLISLNCSAQNDVTVGIYKTNPSDQLQIAAKHHYIGLALIVVGTPLLSVASTSKTASQPLYILGGGLCLAGLIYQLESWSHIGKAGKLMESKTSSLQLTPVGICYKF